MTDHKPLHDIPSEPICICSRELDDIANTIIAWSETGMTVRAVRGRKMRTVMDMFNEVAAALQFPYYFGENWAAFDECLADMDWLPLSQGLIIVILESDEVLVDAPTVELQTLAKIFSSAIDAYAKPIESGEWWDRPSVPFHIVLHAKPELALHTQSRWTTAGAAISSG